MELLQRGAAEPLVLCASQLLERHIFYSCSCRVADMPAAATCMYC